MMAYNNMKHWHGKCMLLFGIIIPLGSCLIQNTQSVQGLSQSNTPINDHNGGQL